MLKGIIGATNNAQLARMHLQATAGGEVGALGRAWGEVIRIVCDTVRMAGSGLV